MNAISGAGASQGSETHSGMNKDCPECAKLAGKLEKCKGSAGNNESGGASDKTPRARKEECKHLRMRVRKDS